MYEKPQIGIASGSSNIKAKLLVSFGAFSQCKCGLILSPYFVYLKRVVKI